MTTIADFIDRFVEFAFILSNLIVCIMASTAYQVSQKRSLLLIAVSAGIGAILAVAPWIRADEPSWLFWGFYSLGTISSLTLWVIGLRFLIRDFLQPVVQPIGREEPPPSAPIKATPHEN